MLGEAERSLILICARQTLPEALVERARAILRGPLAWEEMVEAASRHGVAPLLFRNLEGLGATGNVAPERLHPLRQAYVRASFRNQTHYASIAEILRRFMGDRLEIILLKGAALARTVYHDPALRPFADIDLLVPEKRIDDAKETLLGLDYEIAHELLSEEFNRKYHNNLPFVRRLPQPVHVELHWRLSDPFSLTVFDHDSLFQRARRLEMAGGVARVLEQEDQFVYLAAHLDNHGYLNRIIVERDASAELALHELSGDRLIWFTDIHELIEQGLHWVNVLDFARSARASDALAVSLRLLQSLLGTPIPDAVFAKLPLPEPAWPERMVGNYVISLTKKPVSDISPVRFRRRFLSTRKGFELRLIRLLDLWQYVFPKPALVEKFYPLHVCAALARCIGMLLELVWWRALQSRRAKGPA
jgi:hypothetical protein